VKVWVWADVTPDGPAPSALELLTKARELGDEAAAIALGPGAKTSADVLGEHGARTVFASDDEVFANHLAQPAVHALAGLVHEHAPDLILFPASYDARDVAGRLQARTGSTLMANATDVLGPDEARTEILGGTKVVDVELRGPTPRLVIVRPQSFVAEPSGGTAEVVEVKVDVPEELTTAERIERHEESASGPRLESAKLVIAGGRGLGGPDAFEQLDRLAAAIGNAAVGALRAAVDAGWASWATCSRSSRPSPRRSRSDGRARSRRDPCGRRRRGGPVVRAARPAARGTRRERPSRRAGRRPPRPRRPRALP